MLVFSWSNRTYLKKKRTSPGVAEERRSSSGYVPTLQIKFSRTSLPLCRSIPPRWLWFLLVGGEAGFNEKRATRLERVVEEYLWFRRSLGRSLLIPIFSCEYSFPVYLFCMSRILTLKASWIGSPWLTRFFSPRKASLLLKASFFNRITSLAR